MLPAPDCLDFVPSEYPVCMLTDDHSPTTAKLAHSLVQRGWTVVVLGFPIATPPTPLPAGVTRITLTDWSEEHLKQQLAAIALPSTASLGGIGSFIHLNPVLPDDLCPGIHFLEAEKRILKHVFLIAKHLKKTLNQAAIAGRSCFLTVSRLDGAFGLSQTRNFGAIGGGLFGLTKTLNAEWYSVFCRAIDLSPVLDDDQSVESILAEMYDPDRYLQEVAYSHQVRQTLVATAV
jgi:hypothetical protein